MILPHYAEPVLLPADRFADYKKPMLEDIDHYTSWAHACLDRGQTSSNFTYAGGLAEAVLLGTVAIRFPKEQLNWDAKAGQFLHHSDANGRLTKEYRQGWMLT